MQSTLKVTQILPGKQVPVLHMSHKDGTIRSIIFYLVMAWSAGEVNRIKGNGVENNVKIIRIINQFKLFIKIIS